MHCGCEKKNEFYALVFLFVSLFLLFFIGPSVTQNSKNEPTKETKNDVMSQRPVNKKWPADQEYLIYS